MILLSPKNVALLNSLTLILIGLMSYIYSSSWTPLIPVFIGMLILVCYVFYDMNSKLFAHVCVVLMLLAFLGFFKPLMGAVSKSDVYAIVRVVLMQIVTLYSIVCFVVSFIKARK